MTLHPDSGTVVVGMDGSPNSLFAAEVALDEAVLRHLPLRIVYAPPLGHPHSSPPHLPAAVSQFLLRTQQAHPELPIEQRLATVAPSALLLQEAESAALVVVGSHGADHAEAPESGSTARVLAARAACSVLVVPLAPQVPAQRAGPSRAPQPVG